MKRDEGKKDDKETMSMRMLGIVDRGLSWHGLAWPGPNGSTFFLRNET